MMIGIERIKFKVESYPELGLNLRQNDDLKSKKTCLEILKRKALRLFFPIDVPDITRRVREGDLKKVERGDLRKILFRDPDFEVKHVPLLKVIEGAGLAIPEHLEVSNETLKEFDSQDFYYFDTFLNYYDNKNVFSQSLDLENLKALLENSRYPEFLFETLDSDRRRALFLALNPSSRINLYYRSGYDRSKQLLLLEDLNQETLRDFFSALDPTNRLNLFNFLDYPDRQTLFQTFNQTIKQALFWYLDPTIQKALSNVLYQGRRHLFLELDSDERRTLFRDSIPAKYQSLFEELDPTNRQALFQSLPFDEHDFLFQDLNPSERQTLFQTLEQTNRQVLFWSLFKSGDPTRLFAALDSTNLLSLFQSLDPAGQRIFWLLSRDKNALFQVLQPDDRLALFRALNDFERKFMLAKIAKNIDPNFYQETIVPWFEGQIV